MCRGKLGSDTNSKILCGSAVRVAAHHDFMGSGEDKLRHKIGALTPHRACPPEHADAEGLHFAPPAYQSTIPIDKKARFGERTGRHNTPEINATCIRPVSDIGLNPL